MRYYRDTHPGPWCDECSHPATWQLLWRYPGEAKACGRHLNKLAPRDVGDVVLTPLATARTPDKREPTCTAKPDS
ncbi:hypothetical protein HNR23_002293 [Nocardiopsis mwathae]|uniref:Uncharacterized protein n=1 Tax=Nocardiopsis mwathae TaxID=1472723 RepID=A0A7X0D5G7_9ACTN|nr:hypothetical protein [Nocardiopsis mwathae]